jgi:type IV secretory pathway VirB2 component (pilin)
MKHCKKYNFSTTKIVVGCPTDGQTNITESYINGLFLYTNTGVNMNGIRKLSIAITALLLANLVTPLFAQSNTLDTLTSQLCNIITGVRTVIGVIALVMFLIGGILYAVGHFMPAAGNVKASMQGWAMGMILGGVVGVILVLIAPYLVSLLLSFNTTLSTLPTC